MTDEEFEQALDGFCNKLAAEIEELSPELAHIIQDSLMELIDEC